VLLAGGADPNLGARGGPQTWQSPLLFAVATGGNAATARLLLGAGANCAVVVGSRRDPLTLVELARRKRDFDTLQLLTSTEGCDVDLAQLGL